MERIYRASSVGVSLIWWTCRLGPRLREAVSRVRYVHAHVECRDGMRERQGVSAMLSEIDESLAAFRLFLEVSREYRIDVRFKVFEDRIKGRELVKAKWTS